MYIYICIHYTHYTHTFFLSLGPPIRCQWISKGCLKEIPSTASHSETTEKYLNLVELFWWFYRDFVIAHYQKPYEPTSTIHQEFQVPKMEES